MDPLHKMPEFYILIALVIGFCIGAPRLLELFRYIDWLREAGFIG